MKFRLRRSFDSLSRSKRIEAIALAAILLASGTSSGAVAQGAARGTARASVPNLKDPPLPVPKVIETNGVNPIQQIPNSIFEIAKTPETIDRVRKLDAEGEKFFEQKLFDKALSTWQEMYGMSIEMKYAEGEGSALNNMARVFLERGQFTKAKYMADNAVEVLAGTSEKRALGRARILLAQAFFGLENTTHATLQLDEALRMFTQESTTNAPEAAEASSIAGSVLVRIHKLKEALQFYQNAANYYNQAGDQSAAIATHISIASIMEELGLYSAALEEANKAVQLARASNKSKSDLAAALASQANGQFVLCEFSQARKTYEQCFELLPQCDTKTLTNGARANIDLGYAFTLSATGDIEQAKQVFERSLPALKAETNLYGQAQALNGLGVIEEQQGNHGKALQFFSQALDLQSMIVPKQNRLHIIILQNIAAVESRSGTNREAKAHLELALQMLKKAGDSQLQGRTYAGTAEVSLKLADIVAAEAFSKRAIETSERVSDDSALWREYTTLAQIQIQQQANPQIIKETLTSALSHFRSPQAGVFPTPDRLSFPSSREDLGQKLVAMLAKQGMGEQALLAAEQLKEESFASEWLRRFPQVKLEDRDIYNDLSTTRAHLHAAESSGSPDKLIKEWQNWLNRFRTLVGQNRTLARLIAPVPNTTQDIMRVIKNNHATIVEYLVGGDSSVVFTVDGTGRISATVLNVGRKQLQSQVSSLLAASTSPAQDATRERQILQALYNELLPQGVRNFLPKNADQMVVIIPDGVLFNLPFAALVDGQGHYLVEHNTLTMASSMGVFLDSPPRYTDDNSVVLTTNQGGTENNMISSVFQPDQVTKLDGRAVDIGAIQEQIRGKSIVHFSYHVPLSSNPMRAVLPFLPDKEDAGKKVTAESLFGISMPSDLIVWSNSSINAKDVQGNAVKVFTRGLNYAGARNVLMSLWVAPEPDRTNELVEFYRNKNMGLNQAQSLRKAQMLALSKDPSPRAWASFQLLGPGF